MQPPPVPGGMEIRPAPAWLPLCGTNIPSPLMLVSLPSKTGDFRGSSVWANQFQYYQMLAGAHDKPGVLWVLRVDIQAGSPGKSIRLSGPSRTSGQSTCASSKSCPVGLCQLLDSGSLSRPPSSAYSPVDASSLVDVLRNEVVVSVPNARREGRVRLGRQLQQTVDCRRILFPLFR